MPFSNSKITRIKQKVNTFYNTTANTALCAILTRYTALYANNETLNGRKSRREYGTYIPRSRPLGAQSERREARNVFGHKSRQSLPRS